MDVLEKLNNGAWGQAVSAEARDEIARLRRALHEIAEEWAGAECGEPVHAQEAYAIGLAKRMYALAVEGLTVGYLGAKGRECTVFSTTPASSAKD